MNLPSILLIDKPKGITSFDVIRKLRKKLNIKKMGHGGTLDPLATGLMIIGVEKGTKELTKLIKLSKVYQAEVLLGVKTTTGDMEGEIIETKDFTSVETQNLASPQDFMSVLNSLVGKLILPVPAYSAIKVKGEPLYKKARRGEDVETPKREMEIFWIKLLEHFSLDNYYVLKIELKVSSGTYIRSIAEEIGRRLGYPATIKELRRTEIGDFKVTDAETVL